MDDQPTPHLSRIGDRWLIAAMVLVLVAGALFTWWMGQPFRQAAKDLDEYEALLRSRAATASPWVSRLR